MLGRRVNRAAIRPLLSPSKMRAVGGPDLAQTLRYYSGEGHADLSSRYSGRRSARRRSIPACSSQPADQRPHMGFRAVVPWQLPHLIMASCSRIATKLLGFIWRSIQYDPLRHRRTILQLWSPGFATNIVDIVCSY